MDELSIYYLILIIVLILYGLGFYFWGYRSGLKKAADDMEEILEDCRDFDGYVKK